MPCIPSFHAREPELHVFSSGFCSGPDANGKPPTACPSNSLIQPAVFSYIETRPRTADGQDLPCGAHRPRQALPAHRTEPCPASIASHLFHSRCRSGAAARRSSTSTSTAHKRVWAPRPAPCVGHMGGGGRHFFSASLARATPCCDLSPRRPPHGICFQPLRVAPWWLADGWLGLDGQWVKRARGEGGR